MNASTVVKQKIDQRALVVICKDCGMRGSLDTPQASDSKNLREWLSSQPHLNDHYSFALSECLDICPRNRITVAVPKFENEAITTRYLIIDPTQDRSYLLNELMHAPNPEESHRD